MSDYVGRHERGDDGAQPVGKVATGMAPAALVTGLGLPALDGLIFLSVLVLSVACWVIGSQDRTDRVSRVLLAWRGNANCLARDGAVPPSAPAPLALAATLLNRSPARPDPETDPAHLGRANCDSEGTRPS